MAAVIPIGSAADDSRPSIHITTQIADVVDLAVAALGSDTDVFQRDGYLVHVVRTTDDEASEGLLAGTPQIRRMAAATLLERLTRVARWEKGARRAAGVPPPSVVHALLARGEYPGIRPLIGILEAPSLRPDGELIQIPGYDRATGYLYSPSETFAKVSSTPTVADARRARELLEDVVADFPFERPELGRSVFLAALMSAIVRPAILGSVPGFVKDANTRGSGKTLLADVLALITTGRAAGRMTFTQDEAELEKVLSSFALRGAGIVCFDNVTKLGGEPLDKVLTAIDQVDLRVLGRSEIASLPWRAVVIATGNNVEILGDTCRRVLVVRLDSAHERPEERTDFRHADLRAYVLERRADLVVAALTILRAWHVAGRPPGDRVRWGSFESWSDLIPPAIVFAGGVDPMAARPTVMGIADSETSALAALLDGWAKLAPTEGMTVKSAIATLYPPERQRGPIPPDGYEDVREAIEAIAPPIPGKPPSPARLGYALRRYRRRVVGGRMLDCAADRNGIAKWRVMGRSNEQSRTCKTVTAGDAGDAGDVSSLRTRDSESDDYGSGWDIPRNAPHPPHSEPASFLSDLGELGVDVSVGQGREPEPAALSPVVAPAPSAERPGTGATADRPDAEPAPAVVEDAEKETPWWLMQ